VRSQLLYDADCGFCTRAAGLARRLPLQVEIAALQSVDLERLGVSPERALAEMPYVAADGSVSYGHEAVAAALGTGTLPFRTLGRLIVLPGIGRVSGLGYRWIARHRHQLPGGTPACALPPTGRQAG
jgi:predicted DCC family thiol-disulfide oxidoreductase YuxK